MSERVWYFVHIPKTAGTTVRHYLGDAFGEDEVLYVYPGQPEQIEGAERHMVSLDQVAALPPAQLARYRVFYGHYPFRAEWMHYGRGRGLAFVRDPVARVISWYHYMRNADAPHGTPRAVGLHQAIRDRGLSLPELYAEVGGIREIDNGIVRFLAGGRGWPVGAIGEVELRQAMDAVEQHFDFVGHAGRFEESMQRLGEILGRPYASRAPANTSSEGRAEEHVGAFPPEFMESITAVDRAFVNWVEERFL